MLTIIEELGNEDDFSWDTLSWSFPNLLGEENSGPKLEEITNNSDVQKEDKVVEMPPPAPKGKKRSASTSKGTGSGGDQTNERKGGGGESDDHELHIWTERERRKKMRNMFANLHALLPQLPPKADKSTIVDEAVNYIKKMQQTLGKLEKQKLERVSRKPINIFDPSKFIQQKLGIHQSREAFLADHHGKASTSAALTLANTNNIPNPLFSAPQMLVPPSFKTWTSPNVTLNVCGEDAHISVCGMKKPGMLTAICFVLEKYKLEVVSAQVSSDTNRFMYVFHARGNGISDGQFPVEEVYKQAAAEILLWVK